MSLRRVAPCEPVNTGYGGLPTEDRVRRTLPPVEAPEAAATASVGADGRARLEGVPPGIYFLEARAAGRARYAATVAVGEPPHRETLVATLGRECILEGRVLGPDGTPMAHATVRAFPDHGPYGRGEQGTGVPGLDGVSGVSGPDGRYRIEGLGKGLVEVRVEAGPGRERSTGSARLPIPSTLDLRLEATARVRGSVTTANGAPAADATIVAWQRLEPAPAGAAARTRSAKDGSFVLEGLLPGVEAHFVVLLEGWLPETLSLTPGEKDGVELPAIRLRPGAVLRGVVRSAGGKPVPFASVWAIVKEKEWGAAPTAVVRTGSDGTYRIPAVPQGRALVGARSPGLRLAGWPETISEAFEQHMSRASVDAGLFAAIPASGESVHDIALEAASSVEGVVVGADGSPVPGAWVEVGHKGDGATHGRCACPTRPDGRFVVEEVAAGRELFVYARTREGAQGWSRFFDLAGGEAVRGIRVRLGAGKAAGGIEGVVRRADGRPLVDAEVRIDGLIAPEPSEVAWTWVAETRSWPVREDGTFRIPGVAPGRYGVYATAEGCALGMSGVVVVPESGSAKGIEIVLAPGLAIAGRVVDAEGRPVPGAIVQIEDHPLQSMSGSNRWSSDPVEDFRDSPRVAATADSEGRFAKGGLPARPHWVTATAQGFGVTTVKTDPGAEEVRLVLLRTLSISGTVVNAANGKPAPGISVWCPTRPESRSRRLETRSGPDGKFSVSGRPPGKYTLAFGLKTMGGGGECRPKEVEGVEAGTADLRVEVEIGLAIAGRILDLEGKPVTGVSVGLYSGTSDFGSGDRLSKTGPDGSFRIPGLEPGDYTLRVPSREPFEDRSATGTPAPVRVQAVAAGTEDLTVKVVRGVPIRGRVLDPSGKPAGERKDGMVGFVQVTPSDEDPGFPLFFQARVKEDGSFLTEPLDPGKAYDLEADGFEGTAGAVLPGVRPGGEPVVLKLDGGLTTSGVLVDEEGRPVGEGVPYTVRVSRGMSAARTTGPDGTFVLRGLPPGKHAISAGGRPSRYLESRGETEVEAGTAGVVIKLRTGATLSGTLLDAEGRPVAETRIWADNLLAGDTNAAGRFLLVGFEPGKKVTLTSSHRNGKNAELGTFTPPAADLEIRMKPMPPLDGEEKKDSGDEEEGD